MEEYFYAWFCDRFREMRQTSDGWWRFNDPFGFKKDKTCAVNFNYWRVMDWRQNYSYTLSEFVAKYEGIQEKEVFRFLGINLMPSVIPVIETIERPAESQIPESFSIFEESYDGYLARKYIEKRKLSLDFCNSVGIRLIKEGKYRQRLLIPFLEKGITTYFQARDYTEEQMPKYRNPDNGETLKIGSEVFYNQDALEQKKVYLVEGCIDALTGLEKNLNFCATNTWRLSEKKRYLLLNSNIEEYVVIADKGFFQKTKAQYSFLIGEKPVKVIDLDNEEGKDVNDLGVERILELEQQSDYLNFSNLF